MAGHYLAPRTRITNPKRVIFLDTESYRLGDVNPLVETQIFRLAVARFDHLGSVASSLHWKSEEPVRFASPTHLWRWIDSKCIKSEKTVIVCHNLSYDIRVSGALTELVKLGWRFDVFRMGENVTWCQVSHGKRKLLMVDLFSWLPMSLKKIGTLLETHLNKPSLPEEDDSDDVWFARCEADVNITAAAWHEMRKWTQDKCSWKPTGTSHGWNFFLTQFLGPKELVVHDDWTIRKLERHAAYCGRAEAYFHGSPSGGPFYSLDFKNAYGSICSAFDVPTSLLKIEDISRLHPKAFKPSAYDLVSAKMYVPKSDALPVLPMRHDGRIIWPTGELMGVWWGTELSMAIASGAVVERWGTVARYDHRQVLREWAQYLIGNIDSTIPGQIAKHWARTVVGRFGMQFFDYVPAHQVDDELSVYAGQWFDGDGNEPHSSSMQIGNQVYVATQPRDGDETLPQIMSYVMMLTRCRLYEAMRQAGFDNVFYCDTDGLIVNREGFRNLQSYPLVQNGELRLKEMIQTINILGPKQLIVGKDIRIAGMKAVSGPDETGAYGVELWERMRPALQHGRTDQVRVKLASMHISGRDGRRKDVGNGFTEALHLEREDR